MKKLLLLAGVCGFSLHAGNTPSSESMAESEAWGNSSTNLYDAPVDNTPTTQEASKSAESEHKEVVVHLENSNTNLVISFPDKK